MGNADRSVWQDKLIKRYYANKDQIMTDKISDLMADLYLAAGKKRESLWKRVALALAQLEVPQDKIDQIIAADKPELLSKYIGK